MKLLALNLLLTLTGSLAGAQGIDAGIRGRILLPDGTPAAGVRLVVDGFDSNDEDIAEHGLPWNWEPLVRATDLDGSFQFAFHPPQSYQMEMSAELTGYASVRWKWFVLPFDEWTEVGDVHLEKGETLTLQIVTPDGANTDGTWWYVVKTSRHDLGHEADPIRVFGSATCTDGRMQIHDLPPGLLEVNLNAAAPAAPEIKEPVRLKTGGTHHRIIYEGPAIPKPTGDAPNWLVVIAEGLDDLHISAADGKLIWPTDARFGRFLFRDLADEEYAIEITDERFLPVKRSGIRPGGEIDIKLTGSSALRVLTQEALSGNRIEYDRLLFQREGWEDTYCGWLPGERPPESTVKGLIPGYYTLRVSATGYRSTELTVEDLAAHETRTVRVGLERTTAIFGHLRDASGNGIGRIELRLRGTLHSVRTRSDGAFTFDDLTPGTYLLEALVGGGAIAEETVTLDDAEHATVELWCDGAAWIEGRLSGIDKSHMRLLQVLAAKPDSPPTFMEHWTTASSRVDDEGHFELGPLPCSPATLYLAVREPDAEARGTDISHLTLLDELTGLPSGTTVRPYDLTARGPGSLRVRVRVNGERDPDLVVAVHAVFDPPLPEHFGIVYDMRGRTGLFQLPTLLPGQWKLSVWSMTSGWNYEHPDRITIGPGGRVQVDVDVPLSRGRLLVLHEETGQPFANRYVGVSTKENAGNGPSFLVGLDGYLELELPAGEWLIWDLGEEEGYGRSPILDGTVFEWTQDGPKALVVRVKRHQWR